MSKLRGRRPTLPCLEVTASPQRLAEEAAAAAAARLRVDKFLVLAERSVAREFHILDELVRSETREQLPRLCHYNPNKDLHDDVVPYMNHHAQTLAGGYVNASLIRGTFVNGFIAAQGPLKSTVGDFWSMIVNHHVTCIVALCADGECASYLPSVFGPLCVLGGAITVQFESEETLTTTSDLHCSRFRVSCGGKSWVVTRLHLSSWRDEDVCSPDSLLHLAELVNTKAAAEASTVVHCRAGAGRTGCFIALCELLADVKSQMRKVPDCVPCASVVRTVVDLRKHRPHMVQTSQQYAMVYRALGQWFQDHGAGQSDSDSSNTVMGSDPLSPISPAPMNPANSS